MSRLKDNLQKGALFRVNTLYIQRENQEKKPTFSALASALPPLVAILKHCHVFGEPTNSVGNVSRNITVNLSINWQPNWQSK